MPCITLAQEADRRLTIMLFVEGIVLRPKSPLFRFAPNAYIPIGDSAGHTLAWHEQGADIVYCTSFRGRRAEVLAALLPRSGFSGSRLFYRARGQSYAELVERAEPDILIGGAREGLTRARGRTGRDVHTVLVPEAGGLDGLPLSVVELAS